MLGALGNLATPSQPHKHSPVSTWALVVSIAILKPSIVALGPTNLLWLVPLVNAMPFGNI